MAKIAIENCLADASVAPGEIKQVMTAYCYGDSTSGQRAVYDALGLTGVPIVNCNNNCSSGSTALWLARQTVRGGLADCVLAVGFEKMERGSLKNHWEDRTNPMDKHVGKMLEHAEFEPAPVAPQLFGNAGKEHIQKYGTKEETFAKIAEKNHRHSQLNPYSQFRKVFTLQQILEAPRVATFLTKLQCCPTSDGAGAALLVNEDFVIRHNLQDRAVEIAGMAMTTDTKKSFEKSMMDTVGFDMSKRAAEQALKEAGVTAKNVDVVELHDCFSANELVTYEALGLCEEGQAEMLVNSGNTTFGGKGPIVNPSGGLISKGHPLGATGLAQLAELSWQLRQMCGPRQVPKCKLALAHNIGLGGAAVVTVYRLGFPSQLARLNPSIRNPALEIDPREPTHDKDSIFPNKAKL